MTSELPNSNIHVPIKTYVVRIILCTFHSNLQNLHDGPAYLLVFTNILRDISKEETVEYVLALIDEMLTGKKSLKHPSHPTCSIPFAVNYLANLPREPSMRVSFVQADGVNLLIPLISPASNQQSIQLLYETCLWIWFLSYYDAAVDYLATIRVLPRLVEVAKGSTKKKVVRVIVLTLHNLLPKPVCGAQMIDIGLSQVIQSLKAQPWSDEEVLLGYPYWYPVHKDPGFWQENITNFEENDFQVLRVLVTILHTCTDAPVLAVACYDLSQFIQYHLAGRIIVSNLKAKDRMMKL
ncbi:hypothetical protein ZIOFF_050211 [Zingiber officinale]|uniref:ATPase V1 complex subunit H C-terminal domain-containing protein n=1 Tax=Zingiber officinale TaxID=94328 RepID=A0A8J5FJW9_ZINOF|nr:hypothetical protein ZIOFF_050211 [Zingiber officinale]